MEQKNLQEIGTFLEDLGITTLEDVRGWFQLNIDIQNVSLAEAIEAGKYDWVGDYINKKNEDFFSITTDPVGKKEATLLHFNHVTSLNLVKARMNEKGCRPLGLRGLLALGAKYPELQKRHPIIALGSIWLDAHGFLCVPDLWSSWRDGKRYLSLRSCSFNDNDAAFDETCRFLAVRK